MSQYFNQQMQATDSILSRLRVYRDPQRVRNDVLNLLKDTPSLQPAAGSLARGSPTQLLYLAGTVPIIYNNAQYNIPMHIWIVDQYPMAPPVCYVTPTQSMIIKPKHRHVDSSGMCYLPYISNWNPNNCNLMGLIQTISKTFGQDPPVRAAPPQQKQQPAQQQPVQQPVQKSPIPTSQPGQAFENPADVITRNASGQVTQKIQQRLAQFNQANAKEINETMEKNSQLEQLLHRTESDIKIISQQNENMESDINTLTDRLKDLVKWLEQNDGGNKLDIDAVTEPKDPLSKQLLDLVASDATIEDVLYYLEKALSKGDLSADLFLKTVRNLASEQFIKRATIKKIHDAKKQIR